MPWRENTIMSQRKEFVSLARMDGANISELCRSFGISRKTGHKWLRRYLKGGYEALEDLSKRPRSSPNRTSHEMEQAVVKLRLERPAKGAHVIARMLRDRGYAPVPAKSTINAILRRYGFIEPSASAKAKRYKRFEHQNPNDLWQMDFKGHFPMTGGHRCHPLTVLDDHSRFSLGVRACLDEKGATVQRHLADIFRRYGLPHAMLMDNGSPWGVDAARSFTAFAIWLMELGVKVIHSRPRHPQTIGKLERFHKSLNVELLQGNSYRDVAHAQRGFDRWRDFYNLERPHHSLKFDTPSSRYVVSPRAFPEGPPVIEYHDEDRIRAVDVNGRISFRGRSFPVGKAFRGKQVALRPAAADGAWTVFFSVQPIATIDFNH